MLRTLRSRNHRLAAAATGVGVLAGAFILLQFGPQSASSADVQNNSTQLAVAERGDDEGASRGSDRSGSTDIDLSGAEVVTGDPAFYSALKLTMLATTTTVPPTTTTTTVPPTTTTTVPPTTTTAKPKPKPQPKPKVEQVAPASANNGDVWSALAKCESGMRNDGGAPYYGYFQFSAQTWKGVGGSGLPDDHSYDVQLEFAKKLQARSGWGQWPVCSKKIGAR